MTLMRWHRPEPPTWAQFERLNDLKDEIDQLFNLPLVEFRRSSPFRTGWGPAVDLYEDKDNFIVTAEVPGMNREGIDVSLHDGALTIAGERAEDSKQTYKEAYRTERFFGRFHRTVTLPKPVDGSKVQASYEDGILTVTLPKAPEAKPKQIEISVK